MFSEHKKTRVPGEPRDFVDCYFDEMEKVCVLVHGYEGQQRNASIQVLICVVVSKIGLK